MELIEVIKEPYFCKKNISVSTNKFVLTFLVDRRANKVMIKKAFRSFFGVQALAVNTLIKHSKPARITLKSRKNFTKPKKIAFVSLSREDFLSLKRALEGDSDLLEKELSAMKNENIKESESKSIEIEEVEQDSNQEVKEELKEKLSEAISEEKWEDNSKE